MSRRLGAAMVVAIGLTCGAACSAGGPGATAPRETAPAASAPSEVVPADSAVALATTACGDTSKTTGSGTIIDDGLVLTAAHVVIGAGEITLTTPGGVVQPADLVGLDPQRDLALLRTAPSANPSAAVATATARSGDAVTIVGSTSGTVATTLGRRLTLRVDDVRASTRSERQGWDLPVSLLPGDSGAAVWDADGQVVAVIFSGTATGDGRSFAVDAAEVRAFLTETTPGSWSCDPAQDQQVDQG